MPNSKDENIDTMRVDGIVTDINEPKSKLEKYRADLEQIIKERTAELTKTREIIELQAMERNKAEQALREIEREQSIVLDNLSDLIVYRNTDLETVWASKSMAEWHGLTQEQIVGRVCYKARFGRNEPCDDCHIVKAMKLGQRQEMEKHLPDGKTWHVVVNPAVDDSGKVVGTIEVSQDITDRKKAHKELEKSKDILEKTFSSLDSAVFILDAQKPPLIKDCNPAAIEIFGYEKNEIVGKTTEFLHVSKESLLDFQKELSLSIETKGYLSLFEFKMKRKDGTTFPSEHSVRTLKDDNDRLIGWISIVRDITEQKQSEQALRETTGLLETIFEHTHMLVAYLDRDFNFVRVNRAYAEADEHQPSFFSGKNHFDLYPHEENERIFRRVVETGASYFAYAKPFEYAENPERGISYWDWSLVPIKQKHGHVTGLVLTLADVTARIQAEEALQASEWKLDAMLQSISDHMSMIDKDLNIIWANEVAKREFGNDITGKKCYEVYHGRSEPCQPQPCLTHRVFDDSQVHEHDIEVTNKDGNTRYFHCVANVALRDSKGNPTAVLEVSTDITDRKHAEEAVRQERDRAQKYLDVAGVMILVIDADQKVKLINQKGCEILGYDECDIIGKNWVENFVPQRVCDQLSFTAETLSAGDAEVFENFESPVLTSSGEERIIAWHNSVLRDKDGIAVAALCSGADITERKRAEEALRESEEKFRSLAEQSPNMIFINKNGKIVYANKKCEEVMGYSREELCSPDFDFRTLITPESLSLVKHNLTRHMRGEEIPPYDYSIMKKNGTIIEAINTSKLIQYEGQTAILGIVTDITERKKAEQALRESEERLKILFESAPDTIYLINSEGRFIDANRAAVELIGYTRDEIIGRSLAELGLVSNEQLSKAKENLKKVVAGKISGPNEYRLKKKDGTYVSVEVRTFPVKIAGKILTLGIARDITLHKQTEQQILEHQARLKSLASQLSLTEERERHRLATDLHDQISQSLVISKIKLDQFRKSSISNRLDAPLKDISDCLGQIIDDTRALTFDLSYPILYELGFEAAVAEWLTDQIQEEHGIKTEFEDDGHKKPLDDDLRVLLFRNVRELLINVVKHAQASKVKVSIRKVKGNIRVSVEDDGVGFDPVEVVSMTTKRAAFGLFSIRERLEQLGGLIEIDSRIGQGTKIAMTAPLKNAD